MLKFAVALSSAFAATCAARKLQAYQNDDQITTIYIDELNMIELAVCMSAGFFVERDNSLRLALIGNQTTGYEWVLDQESANGAFTVTEEYVQDEVPDGYMGAGGMHYFTINAGSETADGTISFTYSGPGDDFALSEYEFLVHVV